MEKTDNFLIEQFRDMIMILNPCMNDYLFVYDITGDSYCISPSAVERFIVPGATFSNVRENLRKFIYEEDIPLLDQDINELLEQGKEFHNLCYRWLGYDKKPIWINCRGKLIYKEDGTQYLVGCINEIGVKQMADNVSGLLGESSLQNEISSQGDERFQGFMLRIGIDNFKVINENKGMKYGDMILRETAECINSVILPEQKLYKIVADEFVVVDFSNHGVEDAIRLFEEIRKKITAFIEQNFYEVFYTVSAGIVDFNDIHTQTYLNLMKLSEFALNEAKDNGKNKYYVYVKQDYHAFLYKRKMLRILRQSINDDFKGFETHFQPIMDITAGRLSGAETLLRFNSEELGRVSPVEFIPLLEESGLIIPVGRWVLDQAMQACSIIQETIPDFRISVNLSYIQVLKSNVLDEILTGVKKYNLSSGSLVVELTESGFFESDENFTAFCEGLKSNGIPLALDDFGTGYSNFHYLYHLSPNTIKIDRSFTLKALSNDYEYNLLQHMVDMTHGINLKLCIEGIETSQELQKISQIQPDYIQGFYFGKPCNLETFLKDYVRKDNNI